jgi:type IV pilus assembly protein PilA
MDEKKAGAAGLFFSTTISRTAMPRKSNGFTLIELMIVVAIIGILAAIAIPQFQDYVIRSRWSDVFASVGSFKQAVAECAQNHNSVFNAVPCNAVSGGPDTLNGRGYWPHVGGPTFAYPLDSFSWDGTAVTLSAASNNQLGGCTVTMAPSSQNGVVVWGFQNTVGCTRIKTGVGT